MTIRPFRQPDRVESARGQVQKTILASGLAQKCPRSSSKDYFGIWIGTKVPVAKLKRPFWHRDRAKSAHGKPGFGQNAAAFAPRPGLKILFTADHRL
ncbi:hypothetical protein ACFO4N_07400 [Camelliibacillus cellulosilyticus]|uniref:Uncharacterized protein n=1 Tax=Camelliibacillus cellulosilyticus TaxID=2174486 RepID=A0ABV9GPI1_9BACL